MKPKQQNRLYRLARAPFYLSLTLALLLAYGCGNAARVDQSTEERTDPMEMQRVYEPPEGAYFVAPGIRLVSPQALGDPNARDMVIADNVYRLPDADVAAAAIEPERVELPLDGSPYLENRNVGDIVVSKAGGIHWRRIDAIRKSGGRIVWETSRAKLTDVFQHADLYLQVDFDHVDRENLPPIDLTDAYMRPEQGMNAEEAVARQAVDEGCAAVPSCFPADEGALGEEPDKLCVASGNPNVSCALSKDYVYSLDDFSWEDSGEENPGEGLSGCDKRVMFSGNGPSLADITNAFNGGLKCRAVPWCHVKGDINTACPEADRASCLDDSDDTCTRIYTGDLNAAYRLFNDGSGNSGPINLDELRCGKVNGYNRMHPVGGLCTSTETCLKDEFGAANGQEGYACTKEIGNTTNDCTAINEECTSAGECCTGKCQEREVPNESGDPRDGPATKTVCTLGDTGADSASIEGVCAPGCNKDNESAGGGVVFGFDLANVIPDLPGWLSFDQAAVKFRPDATMRVRVEWFVPKEITLLIGADFLTALRLTFDFGEIGNNSASFDELIGEEESIKLLPFSILGYPFSINLDLRAIFTLNALAEINEISPELYFYTHEGEDADDWGQWLIDGGVAEEEAKRFLGKKRPSIVEDLEPQPSGSPPDLPDKPGIEMGFSFYSDGDFCSDYDYAEGECGTIGGGDLYGVNRFNIDGLFSLGIDGKISVSSLAEVAAAIALYEGVGGSRLIGIEPVNLQNRFYLDFGPPTCSTGLGLFYRMFMLIGPIELFGVELIGGFSIKLLSKKLLGFDFTVPEDLGCNTDSPKAAWACDAAEAIGCGAPQSEPPATQTGSACSQNSECGPGEACVGSGRCADNAQPADGMQVTVQWSGNPPLNLNMHVERDSQPGTTFTRNDTSGSTHFLETCSHPDNCSDATRLGETAVIESLEPGEVVEVNLYADDPGEAVTQGYTLTIQETGHEPQEVEGTISTADGVGEVPLTFEYVADGQ